MSNFVKAEGFYHVLRTPERAILVYGELRQTTIKRRVVLSERYTSRDPREIYAEKDLHDFNVTSLFSPDNCEITPNSVHKSLVIGWAIADSMDMNEDFSVEKGIRIASKRFTRPLETYNWCFLNKDMIGAILKNEAKYIADHIDKFNNSRHLPKGLKQPKKVVVDRLTEIK